MCQKVKGKPVIYIYVHEKEVRKEIKNRKSLLTGKWISDLSYEILSYYIC